MPKKRADLTIHGTLAEGLQIVCQIKHENQNRVLEDFSVTLPSNPQLKEAYQKWRDTYLGLGVATRALKVHNVKIDRTPEELNQECSQLSTTFRETFKQWLASPSCSLLEKNCLKHLYYREDSDGDDEVSIIIKTESLELQKLPWHLWELIDENPYAEVVLSSHHSSGVKVNSVSTYKDRVRLLAILGNSEGIDVNADREALESIPWLEPIFLEQPNLEEISTKLWEEHWDILFFAGHSETVGDSIGRIYINDSEFLTLDQVKYGLKAAIARGLQIAIFNSCDGIGLARQLEEVNLPQTVVMREPVRDRIAQEFLKTFLNSFSNNNSFYLAVRQARERLQGLESEFPNASWLPIIFQNSATEPMSWEELRGLPGGIDWRAICEGAIAPLSTPSSSPPNPKNPASLDSNLCVPLTLIDTRYGALAETSLSPESTEQIEDAEEVLPPHHFCSNDEFFQRTLGSNNQLPQAHHRIAIVGETGSGKQMLLQKMAEWIVQHQPHACPIWIPLAELNDRDWDTLEEYLEHKWLPEVLGGAENVTEQTLPALRKLFESERVWLLLEGLDEMPILNSKESPFEVIANQLTSWIAPARVVLTCRANLWEQEPTNVVEDFEIYRIAGFTYPQQVQQFIDQWFAADRPSAERENLADSLKAELETPGKERLREVIKNPICLRVLCQTWQIEKGSLPETKAALYEQFIEAIYQFNQVGVSEQTAGERQQLNDGLGNLALEVMHPEKSQFKLRQTEAYKQLEKPDRQLFQQAIDIGLLSFVRKPDEDPNEWLYEFWHPILQEYFAAHQVEDWRFFLDPERGVYRIFDPHWKEVILLWFGRKDIPGDRKEEFLDALQKFDPYIEAEFYTYRAYFLAAAGIAEFPQSQAADEIVAQVITWALGEEVEDGSRQKFPPALERSARSALQESDRPQVIHQLTEALQATSDTSTCTRIAFALAQLDPGNREAIAELEQLLDSTKDPNLRLEIAASGAEIEPGHSKAIAALEELLNASPTPRFTQKVADCLGEYAADKTRAIEALNHLLSRTDDRKLLKQAAQSLGRLAPNSPKAWEKLLEVLENSKDEQLLRLVAYSLGDRGLSHPRAIAALENRLDPQFNRSIRQIAAFNLGKIAPGHPRATTVLEELLHSTSEEKFRCIVAHNLGQLIPKHQGAIHTLRSILERCADNKLRRLAAYSLAQINPGDADAFDTLVELIRNTQDEETRCLALKSLKAILKGKYFFKTITALKDDWSIQGKNLDSPLGRLYYDLFWLCADRLNYVDFHRAICGDNPPTSVQKSGKNCLANLRGSENTYPLAVNLLSLEGETDSAAIAQVLCNKIYAKALPSFPIPAARNFAELERWLLTAKQELETQNLALILHECDPYPELLNYCRRIAASNDVGLHLAWITDRPLEKPICGFSPQDGNLEAALQQWLSQLG
ncbi:HEAT repeat domain-containing protein [Phormidium sp. CCY1219]|uniref:HEAT repeat domain-containing protein n=1 Tax=Phormidium sp. CCY1219 TaxID=2886104 RepID=UPI002D1F7095|nr:HEAT repeat domain-containing protein [Phormidium sp. CCY1219]MEB3829339.1 HEAT repeat domain-containing protein [Phormidium sp. CCY1219]